MEGTTHFIEVWKSCSGKQFPDTLYELRKLSEIKPIIDIEKEILKSNRFGFTTLFIWKIKPKNKQQ